MKKVILSTLVAGVALVSSCSAPQSGVITEGNPSVLDSLSYAMGANIGSSIVHQMSDIPFDFDQITDGFKAAAFEKSVVSVEEAMATIQSYFGQVRGERAMIVAANRAKADSVAFANGADTASVVAARAALKADADMFESEKQRSELSYAIGVDLGNNIREADLPVQTYWISQAILDARDEKSKMTDQESMAFLQNYFSVVRPAELLAISAEKMAEIEKMSGVVKTESGLMYRIETAGDAEVIATDDRDVVKVLYTGRLVRNNKVFDTSRFADRTPEQQEAIKMQNPNAYAEDNPIEFPLNRVIPGWTEGMKFVGKGGRISLWIPAELAYGSQGAGRDIGPNEALFFDVEILDVIPFEAAE